MKTKFNQSQDFISIVIMKIFNLIAEYEKKIEIIRRVICDNSQFDLNSIFQFFDKNKRNFISINDIISFLQSKSIFCDYESVKLFVSFYDIDRTGNLNLEEFKNVLISSKDPSLKTYTNQKYVKNYIIPSELHHLLIRLFITEIQFANKLLEHQKSLNNNNAYNVFNLFNSIDKESRDKVTIDILDYFFNYNIMSKVGRIDLENIFSRVDINKDGIISFEEFKVFFNYRNYSKISSMENLEYKNTKYSAQPTELLDGTPNTTFIANLQPSRTMEVDENNLKKSSYNINRSTQQIKIKKIFKSIEEEMFINLLNLIIHIEKEIEKTKIKLIENVDYNLVDVYQIFLNAEQIYDTEEVVEFPRKYHLIENISHNQFKTGINYFGAYPTEEEFKLVLNRQFIKDEAFLDFSNFSNYFLPMDLFYRKILKERFRNNNTNCSAECYPKLKLKNLIAELFNNFISFEANIENFRLKLNKIGSFNIKAFYETINTSKQNHISFYDLEVYLSKFNLDKYDIELLFNRFDKFSRNKINYSDVNLNFNFLVFF